MQTKTNTNETFHIRIRQIGNRQLSIYVRSPRLIENTHILDASFAKKCNFDEKSCRKIWRKVFLHRIFASGTGK